MQFVLKQKELSKHFISKYKNRDAGMTSLGKFVYLRTYSRFLPEKKRREHWFETIERVVNYQAYLEPNISMKEMEDLYNHLFYMNVFPAGRTLYTGGAEISKKIAMQNYNCSGTVLDNWDKFSDLMYLALIGAGIGLRMLKEDVAQLPKLRQDLIIEHITPEKEHEVISEGNAHTSIFINQYNEATIFIGDSKVGWMQAIKLFLEMHYSFVYKNINKVILDYTSIRAKGVVLKTFGGTASGYIAFKNVFEGWEKVILSMNNGIAKSINTLDMLTLMAKGIVAGGSRRIASATMISPDDTECLEAKNNLYTQDENNNWGINKEIEHRSLSNNSVMYSYKPTREILHQHMLKIKLTGEPGFVNLEAAKKRRDDFEIFNPCFEVLLANNGLCNLTTINMMNMITGKNEVDGNKLKQALKHAVRMGIRITLLRLELPEWDKQQQKDRLLGVSLTGYQDFSNVVEYSKEEEGRFLQVLHDLTNKYAEEYCETLGINKPLLTTTIKPSGTLSLLPTVSSGIDYSFAPYYIRRVRISADDPLYIALVDKGYKLKPEVGQTKENATVWVVEFPVKAPVGSTKQTVDAMKQLYNYKVFMENFVEHNVSTTITIKDDEWEDVEQWIWDNWDDYVGVALLPDSGGYYQLLPYEAISKQTYEMMLKNLPSSITVEDIAKFEDISKEYELLDKDCSTGSCPIR